MENKKKYFIPLIDSSVDIIHIFFCVLVCISVGHKPGLESVASILSIR